MFHFFLQGLYRSPFYVKFRGHYAHLHIIWGNAIKVVSSIYLMYFMFLTIKGNFISTVLHCFCEFVCFILFCFETGSYYIARLACHSCLPRLSLLDSLLEQQFSYIAYLVVELLGLVETYLPGCCCVFTLVSKCLGFGSL